MRLLSKPTVIAVNSLSTESKQFLFSAISSISSINASACFIINAYFLKNKGTLISNPECIHTNTKVIVRFFYYISPKQKSIVISKDEILVISRMLGFIYQKEVSLVITRIHYPYINSNIFAQYLVHNSRSNTFAHFQDSILTYPSRNITKLPASVRGIKIELSGRLLTESVVPRKTNKTFVLGSFSGIYPSIIDYTKYTTKNELGAFTIKV